MNTDTPSANADKKPRKPKPARRWARELALQSLYEWKVGGADLAQIEAHFHELEGARQADQPLFLRLTRGVLQEHAELAELLAEHLDRPFAELSPIESLLLLSASYELKHCPETPYRVILNEGIELAKEYGGSDGHRYVNGVLDKMAAKLRPDEVAAGNASAPKRAAGEEEGCDPAA